jgi:hypothetical protein
VSTQGVGLIAENAGNAEIIPPRRILRGACPLIIRIAQGRGNGAYGTVMWIMLFAFALRVTVRWCTGASDF